MTGEWASRIDDRLFERLSAYLDGELAGPDKAAFERRLETDPDLAAALADLTALGGDLRAAFAVEPAAGASDPPWAAVADPPLAPRRAGARRGGGRGEALRRGAARPAAWRAAAAAALALAVGLGAWRAWLPEAAQNSSDRFALGAIQTDHPLWPVLESQPTGSEVGVGKASVVVVGTFFAADGAPCREIERLDVEGAGTATIAGLAIACRTGQGPSNRGAWEMVFASETSAPAASAPSDAIAPASGAGPDSLDRRLEQALDQLGAGPALGAQEEARLIEAGWDSGDAAQRR